MTRKLTFDTGTPFGRWLRDQPELDSRRHSLSIQNLDYVIHAYQRKRRGKNCQCIMLIEEKRFNGRSSAAQADTHGVLDQLLSIAERWSHVVG